jgi:hypothetical protein
MMKGKVRAVLRNWAVAAFVVVGLLALLVVGYNASREDARDNNAVDDSETCAVDAGVQKDLIARSSGVEGLSYLVVTKYPMWSHESRVWLQGNLIRTETVVDGETLILVVDSQNGELLSYDGAENTVTRMSLGEGYAAVESPLEYVRNLDPAEWVQGEVAFLDGRRCRQFIREEADGQTVLYLWEEFGLPLRVESTVNGYTTVTEFREMEVGLLPEDVFHLPAGVPVLDLADKDTPPA